MAYTIGFSIAALAGFAVAFVGLCIVLDHLMRNGSD